MAVTLADRQHSGNDPRLSQRKIMLSFGAIISPTFCRNRGNTHKGSTPPYVSRSKKQMHEDRQRIAPRLWETRQRSGKLLTKRHAVILRAQGASARSEAFSERTSTKTALGPLRTGTEGFTPNIDPFSVSHKFCEQEECFRVFLVHSLCDSVAAPYTLWASAGASTNWYWCSALRALHQVR